MTTAPSWASSRSRCRKNDDDEEEEEEAAVWRAA
jgi:hypothetical protein